MTVGYEVDNHHHQSRPRREEDEEGAGGAEGKEMAAAAAVGARGDADRVMFLLEGGLVASEGLEGIGEDAG